MELIDDVDRNGQFETSGGRVYCIHRVDNKSTVHLPGPFDLGLAIEGHAQRQGQAARHRPVLAAGVRFRVLPEA
jgi:hypothetical protein